MFDNNDGQNRMIMFSTQRAMDFLATCDHIFMDGTVSSGPLLFDQLYTIHGISFTKFVFISILSIIILYDFNNRFPYLCNKFCFEQPTFLLFILRCSARMAHANYFLSMQQQKDSHVHHNFGKIEK